MRRSCTRSWGAWRSSIRIFACWIRLRRRWRRRRIRDWPRRNVSGGGGAKEGRISRRKRINTEATETGAQRAQSEERERGNDVKKTGKEFNAETQRTQSEEIRKRKTKRGKENPKQRKTRRELNAEAQRTQRGKKRKEKDGAKLTTADLVLLSWLAEGPMQGDQAKRELERSRV